MVIVMSSTHPKCFQPKMVRNCLFHQLFWPQQHWIQEIILKKSSSLHVVWTWVSPHQQLFISFRHLRSSQASRNRGARWKENFGNFLEKKFWFCLVMGKWTHQVLDHFLDLIVDIEVVNKREAGSTNLHSWKRWDARGSLREWWEY